MRLRYLRLRYGNENGDGYGLIREVSIFNENYVDITQNASRVHYQAGPQTGTYDPELAFNGNIEYSNYWYIYPSGYDAYYRANGYIAASKLDFGDIVDVRRVTINYRATTPTEVEGSTDGNIWFSLANFTDTGAGGTIIVTKEIPAYFTLPTRRFWGLKIKTHTPGATTDVKITNLRLMDDGGNVPLPFQTRWNMFIYDPGMWPTSWTNEFAIEGHVNQIADPSNTISVPVLDTNMQLGNPGNDGVWGLENTSYGPAGCKPMPYWNNTNMQNNLANAVAAELFTAIFIKFDDTAVNKPKAVHLAGCDNVSVPGTYSTLRYQPQTMLDVIRIDDFTPYMTNGLTITGMGPATSGNIFINGVAYIPDTTKPITSNSLAAGYYTTAQDITLSVNEEAVIHYTINGGIDTVYSTPLHFDTDVTLEYWSVDTAGNVEDVQARNYVIDLNPLVVTCSPPAGTYRQARLTFTLSKVGQVFYTLNGGPEIEYSVPLVITENTIVQYYGVSEGRTYPTVTVNYTIDPNANTVGISPTPLSVYQTPTFQVILTTNI